jgi:hypothetical protein
MHISTRRPKARSVAASSLIPRMPHTDSAWQEANGGTTTTSSPAHDFNRISVHSDPPLTTRVPLRVNTPGDIHEQQADDFAEAVMRAPDPGAMPQLDQRHLPEASHSDGMIAPPAVQSIPGRTGEPLDASTRAFMEPRFGSDFGDVRLHTDAVAADSARSIDALAYTVGRNVVFSAGRYSPGTAAGRSLLAHELAHVVQQRGSAPMVQRAVTYPTPSITLENPIHRTLRNEASLALTTPTVNGAVLTGGIPGATAIIKRAFTPTGVRTITPPAVPTTGSGTTRDAGPTPDAGPSPDAGVSPDAGTGSGGAGGGGTTTDCAFRDFDVKVSAQLILPTAPGGSKWGPIRIDATALARGAPAVCSGKTNIPVIMKGKPDTATFYAKIKANEQEHVSDLTSASNTFLVPHYRAIMALRGSGQDAAACRTDLETKLGAIPDTRITDFLAKVVADIQLRDTPGGHPTVAAVDIKDSCGRIEITSKPKPAPRTP